MTIYLGTDHVGFLLKESLKPFLEEIGYEVKDMGAYELNQDDDYPDFVTPVAKAVAGNPGVLGIILGGSGQGEAMQANRFKGVRAAVFYGGGKEVLRKSKEHNNANILSLGVRFMDEETAKESIRIWLGTSFSEEERHKRRIKKLDENN
ncbi:MAG TPA: RpiB/LacA/LacB family sugar-phosphate isomerase [Candidatus Paceibacterota bacterium]|jgi:ribose 5-phosphate isomerase B|nr:ribose-5-phosphate isomerase [Parcubacteria group bacterium]MDP6119727.1 RpiB/LacA/LacB family sugar-phosphate isomerase [Candidatus Paceibacterota bacterium]HJN62950.1 RpiB/LacA/LacB family sugar-phosphate isomerase [Candidatus Paceibacterota bacterium]|tara:strand:- start:571 stop:1017 length:447 start_codon:yes stop_codon:yes gene_type:complete